MTNLLSTYSSFILIDEGYNKVMSNRHNGQVASPEQLKQIEETIEPFKSVFKLIRESVVVTDPFAHIVYANSSALERGGYLDLGEVKGKNPGELWGGHMSKEFYDEMWETLKRKETWSGEINNKSRDGKDFWVRLQISPFLDSNDEILFFLALEFDVTEKVNIAFTLKEKQDLLELLNKLVIERESRMYELKERIKALESSISGHKVAENKEM